MIFKKTVKIWHNPAVFLWHNTLIFMTLPENLNSTDSTKVSLLWVDSLLGDCTFIPEIGVISVDLYYFAFLKTFH